MPKMLSVLWGFSERLAPFLPPPFLFLSLSKHQLPSQQKDALENYLSFFSNSQPFNKHLGSIFLCWNHAECWQHSPGGVASLVGSRAR